MKINNLFSTPIYKTSLDFKKEKMIDYALESKKIQGAGMDVFVSEPPESNHPFFKLDNILLTPHNAALTLECRERMSLEASQNIVFFLKNMSELNVENLVNKKYL